MNRISKGKNKEKNKFKKMNINKKKNRKKKIIIWTFILFIIIVLAIVMGTYIYKADGNIASAAINMVADAVGDETPLTALVMGISEGIETPLTDTIILVGYNPKTQASFMLSIPRDTFIGSNESTAGGYDKINSLYQRDVKKTVTAVEKLTGVNIDYYIVVKTSALVEVVDAIGGVEFEVPIDMKYDDPTQNLHIDLKKGLQVLDGSKAEQLLRYRHSNPDSNGKMTTYSSSYGSDDFGRMRTQREFITATINQIVSWKNISKIKNILSAVFDNLETNMSLGKMIGYVPSALKLDTSSIRAEQLPGESALINQLWFYRQDTVKTRELLTELMQSLGLSEKIYSKKYTPIKSKSTNRKVNDEAIKNESSISQKNSSESTFDNNKELINSNTETNDISTTTTSCTHDWKLIINLEPTCGEKGARNYRCSKCNEENLEIVEPTGDHTWKEVNRVEPTEDAEGSVTSQCIICKQTNTKTLEKLPKTTVEETIENIIEEPRNNEESEKVENLTDQSNGEIQPVAPESDVKE
ncbi:MAG: LCP family protein [Clostridia bacterium]|nr:LCP family protein [Clostridia bacterium]